MISARALTDVRDASLSKERLLAWLATPFGALRLVIVGIGLYSLLHFAVTQRTREIGLRMALGGTRRDVAWLVCKDAIAPVLIGLFCGVTAAIVVTRSAALLLYGRQWAGAVPITLAVGLIVTIGVVAVWVPARRATAIEPMQALRYD